MAKSISSTTSFGRVDTVDAITSLYPLSKGRCLTLTNPVASGETLNVSVSGMVMGETVRARTDQEQGWGYYPTVPIFWGMGPSIFWLFNVYGQSWGSLVDGAPAVGISGVVGDAPSWINSDVTVTWTISPRNEMPAPNQATWGFVMTGQVNDGPVEEALVINSQNMPGVTAEMVFPMKFYFGWPSPFLPSNDVFPIFSPPWIPGIDRGLIFHAVNVS